MQTDLILEITAAACSIGYSLLLMREKITGWYLGILSSILSMILFYHTRLYAQSIISIYYAGIGVYGLIYWTKANRRNEHIHQWKATTHVRMIVIFAAISIAAGVLMQKYSDASRPMPDAFLTIFGFLASIKEARKVLSSWIYWFFINLGSAWLYYLQELNVYAVLMVVYAFICIPGFISWYRIWKRYVEAVD